MRFFFVGVGLIVLSIILIMTLAINLHHLITDPIAPVLSSVSSSALIVGIVLSWPPILAPFFQRAPRFTLAKIDIDT